MESSTELAELTKTPRRTRRSSVTQLEPTSQHKRSTRKIILPEIEESDDGPAKDPVTPSRSIRVLDFQTPNHLEAASAQTPRRSVRKSIKPVQEYETIVALKGLSAKRAATSSIDDDEEATEGKWVPAVIGRASTKRNKKARRAKKKQLQRQKKIIEGEGVEVNDNDEKVVEAKEVSQIDGVVNPDEILDDKHVEKEQESNGHKVEEEKVCDEEILNECKYSKEEKVPEIAVEDEKEEDTCEGDDKNEEAAVEIIEEAPREIALSEALKNENEEDVTDSSMESGDIEMATMPITADDMESPQKLFQLTPCPNTNLNVVTNADSVNKSNDSDCIMLESFQTDNGVGPQKTSHDSCDYIEPNMPPLLVCSDDEEEELKEAKKIVPKEEESPLSNIDEVINLDGTFEVDESSTNNTPQTPTLRSSITRIPTPFKSNKAVVPEKIVEPEEEMDSDDIPEILLEPREIALKSSRKRSFSICAVRPKKVVTFHSPANTTVSIYDGDLMKSMSKEEPDNITQRRKRSLSVTETDRDVIAYLEQKEATEATPDKKRKLAQPRSKTKMPNFSAIHQQQFQRMESISDHVARKAERAKVLSASKVRPASIQKGLPVKNTVLRDSNKDAAGNKSTLPVPKARQRIELSGIDHKIKLNTNKTFHSGMKSQSKSKTDLLSLDDMPSIAKIPSKLHVTSAFPTNLKSLHLPKPKFETTIGDLSSIGKISSKVNATTSVFTATARPTVQLPKPRFETSVSSLNAPLTSTKLDDRRKRMMDMYKSRTEPRAGERNKEILKGVRTNRRFELQMMCRNRPN